jgi:DDE family transposase
MTSGRSRTRACRSGAILADRLGIEGVVERTLDLGDRPGAANPGRKVMTLMSAMGLGADCIDDCDVLRSGQTSAVLGHGVAAPSTLGTFLRTFTFGHVRQLDRVLADCLGRAWAAGAGPDGERLVVDVDSFVGEVSGHDKQGAGYRYTHKRGYHPIVATRAGTGEVLHIRARKGQAHTARGVLRFVEELIPRVQRAGATGPKLLRADSGFWNNKLMGHLHAAGWTYSIGITQQAPVKAAITAIPEEGWQSLEDYPANGEAQIAQTTLGTTRMIVRRTRLVGKQAELWPDWRHHAFLTNRTDTIELVEAEHRGHSVVKLAIRELKDQALAHFPSGRFLANAAWTVIAALAHNLLRWTTLIGLPDTVIPTARTIRRRLLTIPGRVTRTARTMTLRMPARWPCETQFLTALERLRAVPPLA